MARALVVALVLAPTPTPVVAQAVDDPLESLALALDVALDAGQGEEVLALVRAAVAARPERAADVAATATLMAPWMAGDAAGAALSALPPGERSWRAAPVLAAVLEAGRGRLADRVLAATRAAAPGADPALLAEVARRLARSDTTRLLADAAGRGAGEAPPPDLVAVLGQARGALWRGQRRLEAARQQRWRAALAPPPPVDARALSAGAPTPVEPALGLPALEPPRLPDPGARPSPS